MGGIHFRICLITFSNFGHALSPLIFSSISNKAEVPSWQKVEGNCTPKAPMATPLLTVSKKDISAGRLNEALFSGLENAEVLNIQI